jgi:hypothetical protein
MPSWRQRGGQPDHERYTRALVPPEQLRETFEVKPTQCRGCGAALQGDERPPTNGRRPGRCQVVPASQRLRRSRRAGARCPTWTSSSSCTSPSRSGKA